MIYRFTLISVIAFFLCITNTVFAHKVGNSKWCLMYTSTHWECVYDDSNSCETILKQVKLFASKHSQPSFAPNEKADKKWDLFCDQNPDPISSGNI